ncbi:MAG: zinc-dependent peptidase [Flavobacteriales bacterium]
MGFIFPIILLVVLIYFFGNYFKMLGWNKPKKKLNPESKKLLYKHVDFYRKLSFVDQQHFQYKVQEFLLNTEIIGVETEVELLDKLLIASSAVIPIFKFKTWRYDLDEVILYPRAFNQKFQTNANAEGRQILGMVGYGFMEGKMMLSKEALRLGFGNQTDKKNTAIHEFVHLIDKEDGDIDGIPSVLLENQYTLPWMRMVMKKIIQLRRKKHKDIDIYGATNQAEFFAVISTYFFEQPRLLKRKHPELYKLLCEIFEHKV